ncbi:maleylpyruvate isomerase family mycothiol-dependent enzyme [Streptomyces sp. NPDC048606]|uniref:maleylpyruvate isomerase family mycothiol-dependent enzyme n=1 Tax=Streptomyces sp. NPDC048606 TaxID=3154726 RepID=UPI00341226F0
MDHSEHLDHPARVGLFRAEAAAFEKAVRRAVDPGRRPPMVPSCPGWSVSDLIGHLGGVQRFLTHVLRERLAEPPADPTDPSLYDLPVDPADPLAMADWPVPGRTPTTAPVPAPLLDWSADAARNLADTLEGLGPHVPVWSWSPERTSGFWLRMQTIEQAVHRWDAEAVTAPPAPFDPDLAADAVAQTFEVMAPARRGWTQAPPGTGERYRFRRTDGPHLWTVEFRGDEVRSTPADDGPVPLELAGTASDLMLFLWQRRPADRLRLTGDPTLADHWFTLVPPV